MTSPRLENEAVRLGIIAKPADPFAWLNEPVYEPPLPPRVQRRRIRARLWVIGLSLLSVVMGVMIAVGV